MSWCQDPLTIFPSQKGCYSSTPRCVCFSSGVFSQIFGKFDKVGILENMNETEILEYEAANAILDIQEMALPKEQAAPVRISTCFLERKLDDVLPIKSTT